MNFLGHLLLSYPHRDLTMGNLLGDLIRSKEAVQLSPALQLGLRLHHEIDSYTDSHPQIKGLIALLRPKHAKYAPVVVDILLDYVLAKQWDRHAELSYREFTEWVYAMVPSYLSGLSAPTIMRLEGMVRHRWIDGYDSLEKLSQVLTRMDRRASFPSQFISGVQDIREHYDVFARTFENFYPSIRQQLVSDIAV